MSETDSGSGSDSDCQETLFTCDACRKSMLRSEECWVLKLDAPIDYDSRGFCLCLNCHPDSLCHVDARLQQSKSDYKSVNPERCPICWSEESSEWSCSCRCAICNKKRRPQSPHSDSEIEWYEGEAKAFGDVWGPRTISFALCPDCVPSIVKEAGSGTAVGGEFSRRWFDPHLKKGVLEDEYVYYSGQRIRD